MNRLRFLGLALALLLPTVASAQQPEVVLDFSSTLDRGATAQWRWNFVSQADDGHYFVIPTTEGVWAEFDETGKLLGFFGERGGDGAPGQYWRAERMLPLGGDTLLVADIRRLVWTTRKNEYIAARVINFVVEDMLRLENGNTLLVGAAAQRVLHWMVVGGPGEIVEQGTWEADWPMEYVDGYATTKSVSGPQIVSDAQVWVNSLNAFLNFRSGELTEVEGLPDTDNYAPLRGSEGLYLYARTRPVAFTLDGVRVGPPLPMNVPNVPNRGTYKPTGRFDFVFQEVETEWNETRAINIYRTPAVVR